MFALQYVAAAENGSKISYRTPQEEDRRSQCSSKRIKGKQSITDKSAKFGPLDKNEHFITLPDSDDDFELPPPPKKVKEDGEKRRDVEFCIPMEFGKKGGYISSFNLNTRKWIVQFYDDSETTEVSFPDKEVRLCK
jgi:hypothetical protein